MRIKLSEISLQQIDIENDRYRTRYDSTLSDSGYMELARSVRTSGIITPPLLTLADDQGKCPVYIPVAGFRRLHAAGSAGIRDVLCQIFSGTAVDLFRLAVTENAFCREFSELDKAIIIRKFMSFSKSEDVSEILAQIEGIPGMRMSRDYAERLLRLDNLPEDIKKAVHGGFLSPAIAPDVVSSGDYNKAMFFFEHLRMGLNLQREFWNLAYEISRINNVSVSETLSAKTLSDIMEKNPEISKKRELVTAELRKTRYPHIEKARTFFEETASGLLNGNSDISINIPKNFESREISVTFRFRHKNGYKETLGILAKIGDTSDLDALLSYNLNT